MAEARLAPEIEEIDGERVLLAAELSERWQHYRCCTCSLAPFVAGPAGIAVATIFSPIYAMFGGSARREEAESWHLLLTAHALHFRQKSYMCGMCCQKTTQKTIPLDKIQDIQIVSDCCGDCCGFSEGKDIPWQMHVQTAGRSGAEGTPSGAELVVVCVRDTVGFRRAVLAAKRAVAGGSGGGGPSAAAPKMTPLTPTDGGVGSNKALETLERIEALLREGISHVRSTSSTAGASKATL